MAPSREVDDATGEALTAAELLDAKTIELGPGLGRAGQQAETKMDVAEVVRLQNIVSVLRRMIGGLQAKARWKPLPPRGRRRSPSTPTCGNAMPTSSGS